MREHGFTPVIKNILNQFYGDLDDDILARSELLQYLNTKTISASRGSKARGAFGNIYVLVEDYLNLGYHESGDYRDAEGAKFSDLFTRQRQLPFGSKLQNHALNHRMNQEFRKYFPTSEFIPILRDPETNRYWVNENLLKVKINSNEYNIAKTVIAIIDPYYKNIIAPFKLKPSRVHSICLFVTVNECKKSTSKAQIKWLTLCITCYGQMLTQESLKL